MYPPTVNSSCYGTINNNTNGPHNTTILNNSEIEPLLHPSDQMPTGTRTPDLPGFPKVSLGTAPPSSRWRRHLTTDIDRSYADVILIICYLITGLLDSSSISIWGSFVSMQTGNTVYAGLGLAAPNESARLIKSVTSLAAFCLGSFLFSRFHRLWAPKRRWVLCVSFTAQSAFTMAAAAVVTMTGKPHYSEDVEWHVLLPIALLAFQSGGQAVTSRVLRYNALTSVVLTSIYCDLFSDADLFKLHNRERNQRVGAPVFLFLGALFGGFFAHTAFGVAGALWMASGLKLVVVVLWLVWPAKPKPVVEYPDALETA
ncbi:hypothetical protein NEUTE1DRAFT_114104 [Neurospora tetrasperma FGSC 2508]|uniref:DUF1275 domain protein n=1 Tax=Neurospora tetrasperma (strain FGSC 2508 / ATCC MYA-4615 / P0657) TaxID=510951 RepID=F8N065_NEUT8|nr:uncharacterized protein NEUTE1DRAFT_114104 [Neurospora tetrasperma FGSC 2508]EGO52096.1 hypothetical protein NEUTE1DRAFT_114104 [Neurospora tetrasperma FGSC 2508]